MGNPKQTPLSLGEVLRASARRLENSTTPGLDARVLVQHALGLDDASLILAERRLLTPGEVARIDELVRRRQRREPIAHITGVKEFWSLEFLVRSGVLVPRADSECLIEAAIALRHKKDRLRILDLGTGSGCLLCSLLQEFPNATGIGADLSPEAVTLARENAKRLGLADRADFIVSDWAEAVSSQFDIIISNPPYIRAVDHDKLPPDVRDFEATDALFAGETGLDAYRKILRDAPRMVARNGLIILEIGDGHSEALTAHAQNAFPRAKIAIRRDLAGAPRALTIELS